MSHSVPRPGRQEKPRRSRRHVLALGALTAFSLTTGATAWVSSKALSTARQNDEEHLSQGLSEALESLSPAQRTQAIAAAAMMGAPLPKSATQAESSGKNTSKISTNAATSSPSLPVTASPSHAPMSKDAWKQMSALLREHVSRSTSGKAWAWALALAYAIRPANASVEQLFPSLTRKNWESSEPEQELFDALRESRDSASESRYLFELAAARSPKNEQDALKQDIERSAQWSAQIEKLLPSLPAPAAMWQERQENIPTEAARQTFTRSKEVFLRSTLLWGENIPSELPRLVLKELREKTH